MAAVKKDTTADVNDIEAYFNRKNVRQAPAWMPEPGSTMKGEVIGLKMGTGDYGPYPIIVYRVILSTDADTKAGDVVSVHAFHTLLRESMKEKGTNLGSVQWITYDGKRETNDSKKARKLDPTAELKEYHLYDVENDGEQNAVEGVDANFAF
jgi:hypothetical protein